MSYSTALAAHNRLLAIDREAAALSAAKVRTKRVRERAASLAAERDAILASPDSYERQTYKFRVSYGVYSADRTRVLAYIDVL